jgi:hypothetical protein
VSTLQTAVNLNEEPRRTEYRSRYNIDVLAKVVCRFVRRPVTELVSIPKHEKVALVECHRLLSTMIKGFLLECPFARRTQHIMLLLARLLLSTMGR